VAPAGYAATSRPAPRGGAGHALVRGLLVLVCAAGVVASLVAYRSERRLDEVKHLALTTISRGQTPAERERARTKALSLLPSARLLNPDSEVDVQKALFLERDPSRSTALLRKLTRTEPENIFLWFLLTRKEQREGHLPAARRAYARARSLDPRLPPPRKP
jgi:predicted Zn-dependent protease